MRRCKRNLTLVLRSPDASSRAVVASLSARCRVWSVDGATLILNLLDTWLAIFEDTSSANVRGHSIEELFAYAQISLDGRAGRQANRRKFCLLKSESSMLACRRSGRRAFFEFDGRVHRLRRSQKKLCRTKPPKLCPNSSPRMHRFGFGVFS